MDIPAQGSDTQGYSCTRAGYSRIFLQMGRILKDIRALGRILKYIPHRGLIFKDIPAHEPDTQGQFWTGAGYSRIFMHRGQILRIFLYRGRIVKDILAQGPDTQSY